jgi:hypothetical protein
MFTKGGITSETKLAMLVKVFMQKKVLLLL